MYGDSEGQVGPPIPGTLREELERRHAEGERFTFRETVQVVVPLCTELQQLHDAGKDCFVHPSCVLYDDDGATVDFAAAQLSPTRSRDLACLAPEERQGEPGGARSSVFSIGAMAYEMVTGASVGPGMRRPSDLVDNLPSPFEVVLSKSLVGDSEHRPGDLAALAKALHNTAPQASMPPPSADTSHLDADEGFEVDVSLSLLPPAPAGGAPQIPGPPAAIVIPEAVPAIGAAPPPSTPRPVVMDPLTAQGVRKTEHLAELKAALESDPRPRYVVIKDGMDHGPFTAVELLQQIATTSFGSRSVLRDTLSQEMREIKDWTEFAPFAEQAKLTQDAKQERQALEHVVETEKASLRYKALIGGGVLVIIGAAFFGWWARERSRQLDEIAAQADEAQSIDIDAGLKGSDKPKGPGGGGKWSGGGKGEGHPIIAGGMSCEGAMNTYVQSYDMGSDGKKRPADLTQGQYAGVLNNGSYLMGCGVPASMAVSICAAVQNGRAVGVTVTTKPPSAGIAGCIASRVRGIGFPSSPHLDVARTTFAPQEFAQ